MRLCKTYFHKECPIGGYSLGRLIKQYECPVHIRVDQEITFLRTGGDTNLDEIMD